jgi:DNA polymerase III alpha subunit
MSIIKWPCGCTLPCDDGKDKTINVKFEDELPLGTNLDIYNVNLKCEATWALFATGRTKGIFQLESSLGRQWAKRLQPHSIEDLGALGALLRPGCIRVLTGDPPKSTTERYCDRLHGLENIIYIHPILQPILQKTQGLLVFQEQAMKIAVAVAGFNEQEADILRHAIGKKKAEIMAEVKRNFLDKAEKANVIPLSMSEEIFGWIQESQRYSFNKSHADAYAKNGYWSAYCKVHAPLQFYCSWLEGSAWKGDKQNQERYELVNDAKINNFDICIPDICDKENKCYIKNKRVYFGLPSIKGIGESSLKTLFKAITVAEEALNKPITQWNWLDFLFFGTSGVSSDVIKSLILSGAISNLDNISRTRMEYEYQIWKELSENTEQRWIQKRHLEQPWSNLTEALEVAKEPRKIKNKIQISGGACATKTRSQKVSDWLLQLKNPPYKLEDTLDAIAWNERKYLGTSITCSKVDGCDEAIEANCTCKEFIHGRKDYMKFAVEVTSVKETKTKRGKNPGQDMAFLTLEDHSGLLEDVVCFPEQWGEFKDALYETNTILLHGERNNQKGSLTVKRVWQI